MIKLKAILDWYEQPYPRVFFEDVMGKHLDDYGYKPTVKPRDCLFFMAEI